MIDTDGQTRCDACQKVLTIGEHPYCPHGFGTAIVEGDEIDIEVKHGLCNTDGSPRRFRSRTEMRTAAKARGMMNYVATATTPGPPKHAITFGYGHTKGRTQR